jgi:hypothetical protein
VHKGSAVQRPCALPLLPIRMLQQKRRNFLDIKKMITPLPNGINTRMFIEMTENLPIRVGQTVNEGDTILFVLRTIFGISCQFHLISKVLLNNNPFLHKTRNNNNH